MTFRETEIHYTIWLYPEKKDNLLNIIILSVLLHALFGYFLYFFKPNNTFNEITTTSAPNKPPIHIQFTDGQISNSSPTKVLPDKKKKTTFIPKNHSGGVLSDNNPNSKSKVLVPESLLSPNNEAKKNPFISKRNPTNKDRDDPASISKNRERGSPANGLDSFLPNSSSSYIDQLRKNTQNNQKIEGDSGDIPVVGDDLAPRNGPKVIERFSVRDLGLYQFSQEFKEKFSGIWNSRERWVPPSSPLRPGDIVYYKLYIKGDGSLQKFENLSHKRLPQKDFTAVDKMIEEVVSRVFPMTVPPRFAQNLVTEIVAIQVVGINSPVQYSFQ